MRFQYPRQFIQRRPGGHYIIYHEHRPAREVDIAFERMVNVLCTFLPGKAGLGTGVTPETDACKL